MDLAWIYGNKWPSFICGAARGRGCAGLWQCRACQFPDGFDRANLGSCRLRLLMAYDWGAVGYQTKRALLQVQRRVFYLFFAACLAPGLEDLTRHECA